MNGALEPKRLLVPCNSCIIPIALLPVLTALRYRRYGAPRGTGVELARPADLVLGVRHHFVELRDPAHRARQREDRGEKLHRDADRLLHDAGIEVDVRIELARHEIIVLERDLLERHRELE